MGLFWAQIAITTLLYICGEFLHADMAILEGADVQVKFVVQTTMILVTLAAIPVALRMFFTSSVRQDLLTHKAPALSKWGVIRLLLLGVPMLVNTCLYYAFGYESSFGWLAVIVLLAMPFVYPTTNRCLSEIEEEVQE